MGELRDIKEKRQLETSEIRYDSLKPATSKKNTPFMREIYPKQELAKIDLEDITKENINFDKEDVKREMKRRFRMAWKDPGYCNNEFSTPPIMEAKILNEWEMIRAMQPERAYKCNAKNKGFRINHFSNPFPTCARDLLGENFEKY